MKIKTHIERGTFLFLMLVTFHFFTAIGINEYLQPDTTLNKEVEKIKIKYALHEV